MAIETVRLEPAALYRVALVGIPLAALVGLVAPIAVGQPHLAVLALYLAVPMLVATAIAWSLEDPGFGWYHSGRFNSLDWRFPITVVHVLVSALVILVAVTEVRPTLFYLGVGLIYTLIFVQIIFSDSRGKWRVVGIGYQLMLAYALVVFSVTLNYNLFVGRTDLTSHIASASAVVETGSGAGVSPTYEPFPLWHVYVAEVSLMTGGWLEVPTTMYVLSGLVFAVGIMAVYALAYRFIPNRTYALFAAFVTICFPLYLFYGMYSIPRSITSILFVLVLGTLTLPPSSAVRALTVSFIIGIVVYHPVSIPFVLVLIGGLAILERVVSNRPPVIDGYTVLVAVGVTIIYWFFRADFLVNRLVGTVAVVFAGGAPEGGPAGVELDPLVEVANYVPYSFLVFFLLLGFLFWYRDRGSTWPPYAVFVLFTVGIIPIVFPGPTLLFDELVGVNVGRFAHYSYMFVALTGAYGLYELCRRGGVRMLLIVLVLVSCLSVTAVSNDFVASDNPLVERPFYTFYITDQEQTSFEQVAATDPELVAADRPSCRYLTELEATPCERVVVDEDPLFEGHGTVLIREQEAAQRPLQFSQYVPFEDVVDTDLQRGSKTYDSGAVTIYERA